MRKNLKRLTVFLCEILILTQSKLFLLIFCSDVEMLVSDEDLRQVFERHGRVMDVYIPRDFYNKRPKGFAYIEFPSQEECRKAMDACNGVRIHGMEIAVEFAKGDRKSSNQMKAKDSR